VASLRILISAEDADRFNATLPFSDLQRWFLSGQLFICICKDASSALRSMWGGGGGTNVYRRICFCPLPDARHSPSQRSEQRFSGSVKALN